MIEPLGHNPQTQPITVALKNICREYPAGGRVLRELLQNADDAGASSVKFVLDQTSYPTVNLVDKGVTDYQGPSLLAYNDATFSEKDFTSLSRIGDSCKQQDGSKTGKFGRGFNAVYNWTDSPSIVSRDRLLILDPHHRWTKRFDNPGGPIYDFVENAKGEAMTDQMAAFSSITKEFDRPFDGTIIRIPLRTPEQAQASEICSREASFSDVAEVMQTFADDFGHTGLLFMKNISQISIVVGDKAPINICIGNGEQVRRQKTEINKAIKRTLREGVGSFTTSFEIEIKSGPPDKEQRYRFALHHSIQNYPEEESLRAWSKEEAMIPWVAVASEIRTNAGEATVGSLFNVLPSPIRIGQPIHIHSCFSMTPDRAQLHGIGDNSIQYPLPGEWNHWLFEGLIPTAWADLLVYLAQQYPDQSAFGIWPKSQGHTNNISYHIDEKVLRLIEQKNYRVWYTDLGYVTLGSGLVTKDEKSSVTRKAFSEADVPVIYLPDDLMSSVETTCKVEYLRPRTICGFLERGQGKLRMISESSKQVLLDYVISDPGFRGYGAVELFPFEDGIHRAIDNYSAFIHRDEEESHLFQLEKSRNIELKKLSNPTRQFLQTGCFTSSLHPSLRNRSTYDLKTYCLQALFKAFDSTDDLVSVDENISSVISKVWDWIGKRQYSILDDNISCLWLLPLSDGRYRKIKPSNASFDTIYAQGGELGDFLRSLDERDVESKRPIIQANALSPNSLQLLINAMNKDASLFIKNSNTLDDFILWLSEIQGVFDDLATDDDRWRLHKLLASRLHLCEDSKTISNILRRLKVFQKVVWKAENDHMMLHKTWVTLSKCQPGAIIGLGKLEPIPDVGVVTFLNAESDDTKKLLIHFGLSSCPSPLDLVQRFMIPFWENEKLLKEWTTSGKEQIAESLLCDFYNLERDSRQRISSLAIIPVKRFNGEKVNKFSMAKNLIYPSDAKLRELFFDDEEACPVDWVLKKYGGVLINCGLKIALDDELVVERVKCYAQRSQQAVETSSERAKKLLQSAPPCKSGSDQSGNQTIQELRWLPVIGTHGLQAFNARECRGLDSKLLVGLVLPVLDFEITQDWQNQLGWNQLIPHTTLLKQLERGIEQESREITSAVLKYIYKHNQLDIVREQLLELSCVVTSSGKFVSVQKAFRDGSDRLRPYLFKVDRTFWAEHSPLLKKLGITEKLSLQDLLRIQDQLPSEQPLVESDIPIAIEIIELASAFPRSELTSLKILDDTGRLRAIDDITFRDFGSWTITGTFNSTHPDIPKRVVDALWIEPLSARVKKGVLGIDDADDDEFDQHEDVATAISDTLTRYSVESTFKEFLANADDCGDAKELNWLLDKRRHPKEYLLTDELQKFQGPALLVHNDGVFKDEHFEGLRRVGRGSKRDDASAIGKFGRGSQTMYHWTDVPMLLSGKYLVILDPLRQVLDLNFRTGRRKPGVKIELSKLKGAYRDQLAPFEGLWNFSQESNFYKGTIFRFPLRARTAQSKLMETGTPLDADAVRICLDNFLEREGRIALLFLRRIRYMDFRIHGDEKSRWSIQSEKEWFFSGWTKCTITKRMNEKLDGTFIERWRVAIQDLENDCTELPSRHKRRMKNIECGIAALVPDPELKQSPVFAAAPPPKYFSTLPLSFSTDLPVHIHATFLLASDRASIPIEDSTQEDGAKWNRWLFSCAIPSLYLRFLEDLGREIHWVRDPFRYWPQDPPPKGRLSEAVYTSFWKMLPGNSGELFPVTRQIRAAQLGKRTPPELVKINEAVFDFLPASQSLALRDVLESQIPKLVRPPVKVSRELRRELEVEFVTPKRLRKLFTQENASQCLEKAASEDSKVLEILLEIIKPNQEEDFKELDYCRVLPLADKTLGTLRFATPLKQTDHYFLANAKELKLFDFALGRLVSHTPDEVFQKATMNYAKFNVTRLGLSGVGVLLGRQNFANKTPTKEMDFWLSKFWNYCHDAEGTWRDMTPFTSGLQFCHRPIFMATCNGVRSYVEPEKLDKLPAVIEPNEPNQRDLCNKLPGIYVFSTSFLPLHLRTTESSFDTKASFTRLITTVSKLAKREAVDLEVYIRNQLGSAEIKLLQKLVIKYVSADTSIKDQDMKNLLMSLPVWPNVDSSAWINSKKANAMENTGLLVPWMCEYQKFIEPKTLSSNLLILRELDVYEVPVIELLSKMILPNLPTELRDVDSYRDIIKAIPQIRKWKQSIPGLRRSRLAPNRAKKLRVACEMFDHEDKIFTSAFRNEQDEVFLLRELEDQRDFWLQLDLKHRVNGQFEPDDYILCLTKMRSRFEMCNDQILSENIVADAKEVLLPLTAPSTALDRFSSWHWSTTVENATFPAETRFGNQPPHRREAMALVAAGIPLLQLSDIIGSQHMSVCWSQISFPAFKPTVTTLAQIPSKGKPTTLMAWRHLKHLADSMEGLAEDEVRAFLSDLYDTYDYLQDSWEDSRESFTAFQGEKLWFNLELTDHGLIRKADLELGRCGIENLILESTCETENLQWVRQGLIPYQRLLKALGCKSIVYPVIEKTETRSNKLLSTSLDRLRREEKLVDVTLEGKGGSIRAHKVVLAAASGYFSSHFKGKWSDSDNIDLKLFSHSTLSVVVDFAYTDAFVWKSMQVRDSDKEDVIADKLDDLLDLLGAADYLDMPELLAQVEGLILILAKKFIREPNVRGVLQRASQARARRVEAYCNKFYEENKMAVDLASV